MGTRAHGNAVRVDRIDVVRDLAGATIGQEVFTSTAEFDARDRLVRQTDPLGNVTVHAYDSLDREVRVTDPLANVTEQHFDTYGDLLEVRQLRTTTGDGSGAPLPPHVVRHEHDRAGQVIARVDALGRRTEYRRDKWNRVVEERFPDGALIVTQYDRDSLVTALRDAHGVVVRHSYDALARLTWTVVDVAEVDAGVPIEGTRQIDRGYDALGRLRTATSEVSALAFAVDSLGRPIGETATVGVPGSTSTLMLTRQFDLAGRRTGLTLPSGRHLAYTHDDAGRMRTIQHVLAGAGDPGPAGGPRTIATYAYAGSRTKAAAFANGTSTTRTHDARGGVLEIHHAGPTGTLLRVQQLRDGARAPRARVEAGAASRGERFGYDARYQLGARQDASGSLFDLQPFRPLTDVPATPPPARQPLIDLAIGPRLGPDAPAGADAWVLDLVGNRQQTRAAGATVDYQQLDVRDRYGAVGGAALSYDRAGNLRSDGRFTYVYDGLRRLVRVVDAASGATVAAYDYDPLGRRATETRAGATVVIAYDGDDRIADYRGGACVAQYVHGPGVDDPVELAAAGALHTYHADLQGSVRLLSNATGTAAATYRFDPFGVLQASGGPALDTPGPGRPAATQPFGFGGRPVDVVTGHYDQRARVYVPSRGRFLQRDPAGPIDGHLYNYAGNHPLAFGDPSGLGRQDRDHATAATQPTPDEPTPAANYWNTDHHPFFGPERTFFIAEGCTKEQAQEVRKALRQAITAIEQCTDGAVGDLGGGAVKARWLYALSVGSYACENPETGVARHGRLAYRFGTGPNEIPDNAFTDAGAEATDPKRRGLLRQKVTFLSLPAFGRCLPGILGHEGLHPTLLSLPADMLHAPAPSPYLEVILGGASIADPMRQRRSDTAAGAVDTQYPRGFFPGFAETEFRQGDEAYVKTAIERCNLCNGQ